MPSVINFDITPISVPISDDCVSREIDRLNREFRDMLIEKMRIPKALLTEGNVSSNFGQDKMIREIFINNINKRMEGYS